MRKVLLSVSAVLLLCAVVLTAFVGCNRASDKKGYSIKMNDENWLYEKLPSSAKAGETVTVKIKFATDLGYIFAVNGERIKQDDVESNNYWQFSFTMPDEDVVIDFKTYDGFLPDPAYGTLIETYWLQNPRAEYVSVREYYGEYNNGVLVAMIDAGDNTANEWSEEIAGCSFVYGDGNRLTALCDGKFHTLPEAYEKEYLSKEDIKDIFSKYSAYHRGVYSENECDFSAQYIRTNGYHEGVRYPVVTVIHSVDELNAYYQANKDKYSLERRTGTIYSDSTIGFLDACDRYDEEYFESKILLMVLLEEGSGSIRHKVERVAANGEEITVDITTIVPEVGTDDMAEWHILIEPEAGVFADNEDDITVYIDGRDATEKIKEVYYEKGYANISLILKEGWEYDIVDEADTKEFSVNIYPAGQKDNKLRIYFGFFGVCGTGLKQEEIKLGEYDAWMGTYDNNTVWNFISIKDTFGDYAIINDGGKHWWNEYGDEAMQILETLKVGYGYVSENDAVQIAKDKADSADEDPEVVFDKEKNVWHITLSGKNTSGDDTFVIDVHGNIVDIREEKVRIQQVFEYDGAEYDLSEIYSGVNGVFEWGKIGKYVIAEGHINPHNSIFAVINTETQEIEYDFAGSVPTCYNDDINTVVYAFWNAVQKLDGTVLTEIELEQGEYISRLDYTENGEAIKVTISNDDTFIIDIHGNIVDIIE